MPNFENTHPFGLEQPSDDGQTPTRVIVAGEVFAADVNPVPGLLVEVKKKPSKPSEHTADPMSKEEE